MALYSPAIIGDHFAGTALTATSLCVHDGYQLGIPKWYPQQLNDSSL